MDPNTALVVATSSKANRYGFSHIIILRLISILIDFMWLIDNGLLLQDWVGLPAGVKFDPTDQELIEHLEAKVEGKESKSHPLIDEFIPTIEGEDGICYTHPEKLPGQNYPPSPLISRLLLR